MKGIMEKWNIGIMGQGKETYCLSQKPQHSSIPLFQFSILGGELNA
jgi:hypothetical protein